MRIVVRRVTQVVFLFGVIMAMVSTAAAADPAGRKPAVLGDLDPDFAKAAREAGFEVCPPKAPYDWEQVSRFNVWVIRDWDPGSYPPALIDRFLKAGGGVYLAFFSFESAPVVKEWAPVVAPLGVVLERAQTVDAQNQYVNPLVPWQTYANTTAVVPSPVSDGVKTVWYPDHTLTRQGRLVTTLNMKLSPEWQVVVKGMPTSAAYALAADGAPDLKNPLQKEPPIFAIRPLGEGRVAMQPFPGFYSLGGGYTRMVNGIVMFRGDGKRPSDWQKLTLNAFKWLAEPSMKSGKLGGWVPAPPPPQKPWPGPPIPYDRWETMRPNFASKAMQEILVRGGPGAWDIARGFLAKTRHFKGLLGVHSELSTGKGTVAENVAAAAKAGYDFVVFGEDFEQMTPEKYDRLVGECKKLTTDKVLVLPGMEVKVYRDNTPFHYLVYSLDKYPDKHYLTQDGKAMNDQFDNFYFQNHASVCAIAPGALKQMNSHPWFLRFYNGFALVTYKSGKPIDDSIDDFLYLEENASYLIPSVVHLTYSPDEVAAAARAPFQMYCNAQPDGLGALPSLLNFGVGHAGGFRSPQATFVSSGPMLEHWNIINRYLYHLVWCDRIRVNLGVRSEKDLTEVYIHDGSRPYQRYQAEGKSFAASVEDFHSRYWHFVADARDASGGRMISSNITNMTDIAWCKTCTDQQNLIWKDGLYFKGQWALIRMPEPLPTDIRWWAGAGDNGPRDPWNFMGYPELLTNPRDGFDFTRDPLSHIAEFHGELGSPHVDIVRANYRWRGSPQKHERPETDLDATLKIQVFRPSLPHLGDLNRFYMAEPQPRVSHALLEMDYVVKRDQTPAGTDAPNLTMLAVQDYTGFTPLRLAFTPADGRPVQIKEVCPSSKPLRIAGALSKNGFLTLYPIERGSLAVVAPDEGLTFEFESIPGPPARWWMVIGRKLPAQPIAAGTAFTTRCVLVKSREGKLGDEWMAELFGWLKDTGYTGEPYYRVKPTRGKVESTQGWLRVAAEEGSFVAALESAEARREALPIAVSGLNDNWDAVCLYTGRPWRQHIVVRDGVGLTTLDQTLTARKLYIGHAIVCDKPDLMLRLLDSTAEWCRFQVHNSGGKTLTTRVRPGPDIGDFIPIPKFKKKVEVPAGTTITVDIGTRPPVAPYVKVWDCLDLQHPAGSVTPADQGAQATEVIVARPGKEQPGFLMYEAWSSDEPTGPMTAAFRLKTEKKDADKTAATISVWDRSAGKVLVSRTLKTSDFASVGQYQEFTLDFDRPELESMDYRVQWPGEVGVTVDTITVRAKR